MYLCLQVDAAGFSESLPPFFDEEFAMSIWKEIALSRGPDSHTLEIDSGHFFCTWACL